MNLKETILSRYSSLYTFSKLSGVPYATLNDICNEKRKLADCSARTVYKIADTLSVDMEELLAPEPKEVVSDPSLEVASSPSSDRPDFELFKSHICHKLKRQGDLEFIRKTLEKDEIGYYYRIGWYPECLYLLAMVDYISRLNDVPLCTDYDWLRKGKLEEILYPTGILLRAIVSKDESIKERAVKESIPEFIRFNIVEKGIRDVV
jgi:hypothetical protein